MLPKTVHFISINNFIENDTISQWCLASWKQHAPDWEIKIWTEKDEYIKNIIDNSKYIQLCYKDKNWGGIFDYLRSSILYDFGGIVSELDQILIEDLTIDKEFMFEGYPTTTCGPIGMMPHSDLIKNCLKYFDSLEKSQFMEKPCLLQEDYDKNIERYKKLSIEPFESNGVHTLHLYNWYNDVSPNTIFIDSETYKKLGVKDIIRFDAAFFNYLHLPIIKEYISNFFYTGIKNNLSIIFSLNKNLFDIKKVEYSKYNGEKI